MSESQGTEVGGAENVVESQGGGQASAPASIPAVGGEPVGSAAPAPTEEAYQPDYRYKVDGKNLEFDEWVRPAIKSKETEERLRQLYADAHGVAPLKQERDQLAQRYEGIVGTLQHAAQLQQKGRFFEAAKLLGFDEKAIYRAVAEKLQYEDLPQEQKHAYDERRRLEVERERSDEARKALQSQYETAIISGREMELEYALRDSSLSELSSAVDKVLAPQGLTFRDEVIREGALEYQLSGRDLSTKEAVNRVAARYRNFVSGSQEAASPQETVIVRKTQPKTIPNLGRQGAVGGPKVRTLEDLKAVAKSMTQE